MNTPMPPETPASDAGAGDVQQWLALVRAGTVRPARRADVTETDLDDELILYDPRSGATHALNLSAALVWELCDGSATLEEVAGELAAGFSIPIDRALADTAASVAQFYELGLFDTAPA